jgi:hypothetical protein
VHICTTSPELNRLRPPRDSKGLGRFTCVHETVSTVDERTVRDSGLCHHRTQVFTGIKPILTICFLTGLIIQSSRNKGDTVYPLRNMPDSCNIHSIANSYTVTDKLHRVRNHLSITGCRQPTDCGCSSFHPTIGSEAFNLSTLATPVPSHDITREFSQFSRVLSLFLLLLGSCSL